jgi:hypothetical protein
MLHFSICACHPCAGAMLIFSVSFQFYRMIPEGNPEVYVDTGALTARSMSIRASIKLAGRNPVTSWSCDHMFCYQKDEVLHFFSSWQALSPHWCGKELPYLMRVNLYIWAEAVRRTCHVEKRVQCKESEIWKWHQSGCK